MWKLIARLFGEDADQINSFDLARLTFMGWLVAALTVAAMAASIIAGVEFHPFAFAAGFLGNKSFPIYIGGLVTLVVGVAAFKLFRALFERFGIRLYKDPVDNKSDHQ